METNSLKNLLDTADLIAMLEELITNSSGRLSASALSGMKISLRTAKESILQSHDSLAQGFVKQTSTNIPTAAAQAPATAQAPFQRKDLRASLEQMIEKR